MPLSGYSYYRSITIDHTKCGSSNSSSFAVLFSGTYSWLATVANSGLVQNSNGYDIVFSSDQSTILNFEVEHYVATTGEIEAWINVATISHTSDTILYVYYGNSSISTYQGNNSAVWDSNYAAVFHLQQTSGISNSILDSTSNANNGTPYTNIGTNTVGDISTSSGQIDGAQSFDGTGHAITAPNSTSLNIGGQNTLTLSAWVKRSTSSTTGTIVRHGTGAMGGYVMGIGNDPATVNQIKLTKYGVVDLTIGSFPADTNWHYLVGGGDGSGVYAYVDGSSNGTSGNNQNWNTNTTLLHIGDGDLDLSNNNLLWNGTIDEVRVSTIWRSPDWILTEYNNQSNPVTFYTVGSQQNNVTTSTRTITPVTAALELTSTRTIPATASLCHEHTIPATAALLQTSTRVIPCTAALGGIVQTNATLIVRSGQATLIVRS